MNANHLYIIYFIITDKKNEDEQKIVEAEKISKDAIHVKQHANKLDIISRVGFIYKL